MDYDYISLKAEVLSIVLIHVSLPKCNRSRGGCWCSFTYSWVQRECVCCLHFSKDV